MQQECHQPKPLASTSSGDVPKVPSEYWDELKTKNIKDLCDLALTKSHLPQGLLLPFLNREILVDTQNSCIRQLFEGQWRKFDYPLLELVVLVYLLNVSNTPLAGAKISVHDLKDAHFFQGPHTLKTGPLLDLYGQNVNGFRKAAAIIGGRALDMADASFTFLPLPKIPLYYLLWEGDAEFAASLTVLFDRSIEHHLTADAVWGLVNLVSDSLLQTR
jgi:hypothetical protein